MDDNPVWYPTDLRVKETGTPRTYQFLRQIFAPDQAFVYAEFGVFRGDTAYRICERFPNATLYLFDFQKNIEVVRDRLSHFGNRIHYFGNSECYTDSYNWPLGKLLGETKGQPLFDYCFLDGAHTFAVDALTFFLCDRLLQVGGHIDFDDYNWRILSSSLDPKFVPEIRLQYTEEQIRARQVEMIVNTIVRTDPRYRQRRKNKIFRKLAI